MVDTILQESGKNLTLEERQALREEIMHERGLDKETGQPWVRIHMRGMRPLGDTIDLPDHIWHQLNWVWVANFVLLGAANLYVVYNYSEPTWVKFKLASIIASIVFCLLITIARIWKYLPEQPQKES